MNQNRFSSPLSRDLFALGASMMLCQGEAAAIDAASGDFVTCSVCRESVDGGSVVTVNRKPVCENCAEAQ